MSSQYAAAVYNACIRSVLQQQALIPPASVAAQLAIMGGQQSSQVAVDPQEEPEPDVWHACCANRRTTHSKETTSSRSTAAEYRPSISTCGIGVGLDPRLLADNRGAVVMSLAIGGSAERGGLKLNDRIVAIDTLDVLELMNNVCWQLTSSHHGVSRHEN
eukprot:3433593-Rhodomonas_salina.1